MVSPGRIQAHSQRHLPARRRRNAASLQLHRPASTPLPGGRGVRVAVGVGVMVGVGVSVGVGVGPGGVIVLTQVCQARPTPVSAPGKLRQV